MNRALPWVLALAVSGALAYVVLEVDLRPRVRSDFFFETKGEPGPEPFAPQPDVVILTLETADILDPGHAARVGALAEDLKKLPGAESTRDIVHGPKDADDAAKSPFWNRLLLGLLSMACSSRSTT